MKSIANPVKNNLAEQQLLCLFFLHSEWVNLQSPSFVLDPINLGSVGSLGEKTSHTCDEVDLDLTLENWIWVNNQLDKLLVSQNTTQRLLTGQSHEYLSMFSRQKHLNYSKGWSWNWIFHHHNKVMWLVLKFATYPRDPHPCGNAHLLASFWQVHLVARPPEMIMIYMICDQNPKYIDDQKWKS